MLWAVTSSEVSFRLRAFALLPGTVPEPRPGQVHLTRATGGKGRRRHHRSADGEQAGSWP